MNGLEEWFERKESTAVEVPVEPFEQPFVGRNKTPGEKNILVILPDSAVRYLSKIFDDNWMKENGYLEPEYGTDRVQDLLGNEPLSSLWTWRRV